MSMTRTSRRARNASSADNVVGVRLADQELCAVDREVARLRRESPEAGHASRSSVLRGLVVKHLAKRRSAPAAAPVAAE